MTIYNTKPTKPILDKKKSLSHYTTMYMDLLLDQLLQQGLSVHERLKLSEDLRRLKSQLYKLRVGQGRAVSNNE